MPLGTFGLTEAEELDSVEFTPRKKSKEGGRAFLYVGLYTFPPLPRHLQTRPDNPRKDDLWSLRINGIVHFHKDPDSTFMEKVKTQLNSYTHFLTSKPRASSGIQCLSFTAASPVLHILSQPLIVLIIQKTSSN